MFAAHTDALQTPNTQLMECADDIAISSSMIGHSSLTQLNGDLQFISCWAENNGLSSNPAECVQMVFQISHSNTLPYFFQEKCRLLNEEHTRADSCKYIGAIVSPNFSMEGANSERELTD